MNKFKDYLDDAGKNYYNYLLKEKDYNTILELYRKSYPEAVSIRISFLDIKMCPRFEEFCLKNKIDIITMKGDYSIRFDGDVKTDYLKEKINNLRSEIKLLEDKRLPSLKKQLEKFIEERKAYQLKAKDPIDLPLGTKVAQHLRYGYIAKKVD